MSTMKFCKECDNFLYPMEDEDQMCLVYACRNCDYQEKVEDGDCVYKIEVNPVVFGDGIRILEDVTADPSLPRTKTVRCARCNHGEAVFYQETVKGENSMTLFFVCCNPNCGHRWRD